MFEIIFLGTSASIPTDNRSLPATLLIHEGKRFLVDCGEGTQLQPMYAEQGFNISYIFLTHDHLDHLLGIGGLLFSLSLRRLSPLPRVTVYGGDTTLERVRTLVGMIRSKKGGEVAINPGYVEVLPGIIFEDEQLIISAFRTNHRPRSCFGYTFRAKGKRPFQAKQAELLGVPKGPLRKKLVEGEPVTLPDGKIVYPRQVLGSPTSGIKLVHLGNTRYMDSLIEETEGADYLIAEATFLGEGQIRFVSDSTEPRVVENKIEYAPFSSEAVRLFQQRMLRHLEAYALAINDKSWKERLWLALAASLMFLVAKQTEKGYATVVYVEAVKLLDELVSCLDKGSPLGDIPFPGKHPAGAGRGSERDTLALPSWYREGAVIADIHDGVLALDPAIVCQLTSSGRVAQYFAANSQQPFAVIDGKKQPPAVLLACSSQVLDDPVGMVQERETNSALRTVLRVSEEKEASTVLRLIQQAFQLGHAGGAIRSDAGWVGTNRRND